MAPPNKQVFLQIWPTCFITFMAIIELIAVIILFLTELGNVAANFWITNVFAGGWCGLVLLIHVLFLFAAGCCSPGPKSASRAVIIAFVGLVASAALISFDAAFIAQPTACILTSSCATNAVSNTTFSYSFQQSFFTVFNSWGPFTSYGQSQVKFLCQTIQLGVGALCFILCIIYLIIYYASSSKAKQQVEPSPQRQQQSYYPPTPPQQGYYPPTSPQQGYYAPPPRQAYYPPPSQPPYYQPSAPVWPPPPPIPQAQPGVIPWNANRRF